MNGTTNLKKFVEELDKNVYRYRVYLYYSAHQADPSTVSMAITERNGEHRTFVALLEEFDDLKFFKANRGIWW